MSQHHLETTVYKELGKERTETFPDIVPTYQNYWKTQGAKEIEAYDTYWRSRRDVDWVPFPGKNEWNRHVQKLQFRELVTDILVDLEPQSTFNPAELWLSIKTAAAPEKAVKNRSKEEKIKIFNSVKRSKIDLLREITQIRNSKNDLLTINRTISIPEARAILLVELLASALAEHDACTLNRVDTVKAKKLVFELLWILEKIDRKIRERAVAFRPSDIRATVIASLPADMQKDKNFLDVFMKDIWKALKEQIETDTTLQATGRNVNLVADSAASVEAIVAQARALRDAEDDLVRFQLVHMSDCLPPLSRFVFGHSLDPWQERVLTWIDEGKSVVISAPTSSGKTVLSTYVAVIFRSETAGDAQRAAIDNAASAEDSIGGRGEAQALEQEDEEDMELIMDTPGSLLMPLIEADRAQRFRYLQERKTLLATKQASPRVLFVVPTEPLVWQVAAYFTKLLKVEGDLKTKVGIVTEQFTFNPSRVFGIMPQIVVGTPHALESALTKPRGLCGEFESSRMVSGVILPGGFENFDWVIYDEVHALDGEEGAALQRIIRAMNCPFLALSATVGNADRLKDWFECVRGDQSSTVQALTIPEVQSIVHQTRFINLQRFIWDQEAAPAERLSEVNPLSAIQDADSLRNGILRNSSLSFTSKDCVRVWDTMQSLFPAEAIADLAPQRVFGARDQITLEKLKAYEDQMKVKLQALAESHPAETNALLDQFRINEPAREVNLTELLLELKAKDMTPCLPFHLNTFEAIKLFQQVLSELEWMQHCCYPTYYTDRINEYNRLRAAAKIASAAHGGNQKEAEEAARAGDDPEPVIEVDVYEPHPQFVLSKAIPLNSTEMRRLVAEIEEFDGFKQRDRQARKQSPGENINIIEHPLIRGLKRGIGLFIDEISFPSYRRAVQKLASQGKLGVVISDTSLAFGVNMPFRTCIFCGEMNGQLDELMAQQMSGRAGRRGLDNQGNIIYTGIRLQLMRRLMIGKISDLVGLHPPRYSTVMLQSVLSPRHVGYARGHTIGGASLSEFLQSQQVVNALEESERVLVDLGFIIPARTKAGVVQYIPNHVAKYNYALLAIMWEMRRYPHESITLGMMFNSIVGEFMPVLRDLSLVDKKLKLEIMEPHIHTFFVIMTQLVCRTAWRPRPEFSYTPPKMHELTYFSVESRREVLDRWADLFARQQGAIPANGRIESIPDRYPMLRDPVGPGTEIDGTLLMCCFDPKYVHTLDDVHKQEMKELIWHMGNMLRIMHNCAKIEDKYTRFVYFVLNNAFKKMKNLLAELIVAVIDFEDCTAYGREKRSGGSTAPSVSAAATESASGATVVMRLDDMTGKQFCEEVVRRLRDNRFESTEDDRAPRESECWSDLHTNSFVEAVDLVINKAEGDFSAHRLWDLAYHYRALSRHDVPLLRHLSGAEGAFTPETAAAWAEAVGQSSFARAHGELSVIGSLLWVAAVRGQSQGLTIAHFPLLLQHAVRAGLVTVTGLVQWEALAATDALLYLPSSYRNFRVRNVHAERVHRLEESAVTAEHIATSKSALSSLLLSYAAAVTQLLSDLPAEPSVEDVRVASLPYSAVLRSSADWTLVAALKSFAVKKVATLAPILAKTSFVQDRLQSTAGLTQGQAVLGFLTYLVSVAVPSAASTTSMFLKLLYDGEIADEESIVAWNSLSAADLIPHLPSSYPTAAVSPVTLIAVGGSRAKVKTVDLVSASASALTTARWEEVRKHAQQMVSWLQEAEEDEDEEDDEEEEEDA